MENCELCNEILELYPNDLTVECDSGCLRDISALICNFCSNIKTTLAAIDTLDCIDCVMMDKPTVDS